MQVSVGGLEKPRIDAIAPPRPPVEDDMGWVLICLESPSRMSVEPAELMKVMAGGLFAAARGSLVAAGWLAIPTKTVVLGMMNVEAMPLGA
jgi:hypothetical protein